MASKTAKKTAPSAAGPSATTKPTLAEIGKLGLIIFEEGQYYYVNQGEWQGLAPESPKAFDGGVIVKLNDADDALLVNLDLIQPPPLRDQ